MKTWMKWLLIAAGCLAAAGLLLGGLGWFLGAGLTGAAPAAEEISHAGPVQAQDRYAISPEGIRSLEVEWVSGRILVEPHDGDQILLEERSSGEIREKDRLEFAVDGDTLEIRYWKDHRFRFDFGDFGGKELRILVPRSLAEGLEEISIENVSSDIHLSGLTAGELEVETVSGEVTGLDLTLGQVELESVSGDLSCQLTACPAELKVKTVSGDAELILPEDSRFSVNMKSVSGDVTSEIAYTAPGTGSSFQLESISGDLTIRAAK